MNKISCVRNIGLFYFNDDGKVELFYVIFKIFPVEKDTSVIFIECNAIISNRKYVNWLCVSISFIDVLCDLGISWKLYNDEFTMYIFTGEVICGLAPYFGGQSLDTDPNFGQYRYFFGTIIDARNDRNPYKGVHSTSSDKYTVLWVSFILKVPLVKRYWYCKTHQNLGGLKQINVIIF